MSILIDLIRDLPAPFDMIVLIALIGSVSGIVVSIAKGIQNYFCQRQELDFKREMIDRGMSVAEVEQLMAAKLPTQTDESHRG
jgi:hypothetical protein